MKQLVKVYLSLIVIGLALILFSLFSPRYAFEDIYFKRVFMMEGYELVSLRIGVGLVISGFTFLVICLIFNLRRFSDFKLIPVLKKPWQYFLLTNVVVFYFFIAIQVHHQLESAFMVDPNYTTFAGDKILFDTETVKGIINNHQNFNLTTFIVINALLSLLIFSPRGEAMMKTDSIIQSIYGTGKEYFLLLLIALSTLAFFVSAMRGDFLSSPALLVMIYITISLRVKTNNHEESLAIG